MHILCFERYAEHTKTIDGNSFCVYYNNFFKSDVAASMVSSGVSYSNVWLNYFLYHKIGS
ncbi:hypothetical protein EDD59_13013 [Muricomes intestini]|jgi:hypothetical protein|uniref:Uncharacterized protein n=1 Tax=Muricomes intestini TaxID=1796634 RepID=A0A4R3K089_9FIRM|nr:hypothetical protein EDD59_13013 [Muricomes intestini]